MGMGIEILERLNALPKELSKPDMELEKLKVVVSFLDNGEQGPVHSFKDDEIRFLRGLWRALEKDGRNCEESEKL